MIKRQQTCVHATHHTVWTILHRLCLSGVAELGFAVTLAGVLFSMIWGCGGSSSSQTSITLSGTVVQNAVLGAMVTAFAVDTANGQSGPALVSTTTGTDGSFTLQLSPAFLGPIRLTASGGSFISEMNGATISAPGTVSLLLGNASANASGLSVNPLSTFVDSRTVGMLTAGGTNFSAALSAATTQIENIYGLSTDPGTLTPSYTTTGTDGGNMGLTLGELINCPASGFRSRTYSFGSRSGRCVRSCRRAGCSFSAPWARAASIPRRCASSSVESLGRARESRSLSSSKPLKSSRPA